jgi:hypothetical protein
MIDIPEVVDDTAVVGGRRHVEEWFWWRVGEFKCWIVVVERCD